MSEVVSVARWTSASQASHKVALSLLLSLTDPQSGYSSAIGVCYRTFEFEVGSPSHTHTQPSCTKSVWCHLCVPLRPLVDNWW